MEEATLSAEATARDVVRTAAREREPDRYLAALLAPQDVRDCLIAVAALAAELSRIDEVGEPQLAEIRLQFLRDAISGAAQGDRSGHPIADALGAALRARQFPAVAIDSLIDARARRLYAEAPTSESDLILGAQALEAPLFLLAARLLGVEARGETDAAVFRAAEAYGLARLGLQLPFQLSRGRIPFPPSWIDSVGEGAPDWSAAVRALAARAGAALEACRSSLHGCPAALNTALLPLAVVEPYLAALQKPGRDPARDIAEIAPLMRIWRIGRAHLTGRI